MFNRFRNLTSTTRSGTAGPVGHKVLVYEREARNLAILTLQYPRIETGGSLFGYWTHSGSPVVALAIGPGRNSRHARTSFYQDETYLHDVGTSLYDLHGLQHIGEWHSHHRLGLNQPSGGDANTIRLGMRERGWSRFVLLVTTIDDPDRGLVLANYFLFEEETADPEPLRIMCLPGASPYRGVDFELREEPRDPVSQMSWRPGPFTPGECVRAASDVFPDTWITTDAGRRQLAKIEQGFERAGIACRMVVRPGGKEIEIRLGQSTLLLGAGFPGAPPAWQGDGSAPEFGPWSESTDLVEWFLQATTQTRARGTHCSEGEQANGED